jgi:hypothetical protein
MDNTERCTHCNRKLDSKKLVWLEKHISTHEFVEAGTATWSDSENSQGCFPFGLECARRILRDK